MYVGLVALEPVTGEVVRAPARHRSSPVLIAVLTVLGLLLIVGPLLVDGPARSVAADRLLGNFRSEVSPAAAAQIDAERATLRSAAAELRAAGAVDPGQPVQITAFTSQSDALDARIGALFDPIDRARAPFTKLDSIRAIAYLPYVLVGAGIAVLLAAAGLHGRRRYPAPLLLATAILVLLHVFGSGLFAARDQAPALVDAFAPAMQQNRVEELQRDFVTVVGAQGVLDQGYLNQIKTTHPELGTAGIEQLGIGWQALSSHFATVIGLIQDNLRNFDSVQSLSALAPAEVGGGLGAIAWLEFLTAIALLLIGAVLWRVQARPDRGVEPPTRRGETTKGSN